MKGDVEIWVQSDGSTKLHYQSETEESLIIVEGTILRETNPSIDAYRAIVVDLVQNLMEERNLTMEFIEEKNLKYFENGANRS